MQINVVYSGEYLKAEWLVLLRKYAELGYSIAWFTDKDVAISTIPSYVQAFYQPELNDIALVRGNAGLWLLKPLLIDWLQFVRPGQWGLTGWYAGDVVVGIYAYGDCHVMLSKMRSYLATYPGTKLKVLLQIFAQCKNLTEYTNSNNK